MNTEAIAVSALKEIIKAPPVLTELVRIAHQALEDISSAEPEEIAVGSLVMNRATRSARVNGEPHRLSVMEFDLLWHFARRPNTSLDRQDLIAAVWPWPGTLVQARSVDAHLVPLRRMLHGSNVKIETIYGFGYRFVETGACK